MKIGNYNFEDPVSDLNLVQDVSGIYVILCLTDNQYTVIDIGESSQLQTRLNGHDRADCWQKHCSGTLTVSVLYTGNITTEQRRAIEAELRKLYNPPCGDQ